MSVTVSRPGWVILFRRLKRRWILKPINTIWICRMVTCYPPVQTPPNCIKRLVSHRIRRLITACSSLLTGICRFITEKINNSNGYKYKKGGESLLFAVRQTGRYKKALQRRAFPADIITYLIKKSFRDLPSLSIACLITAGVRPWPVQVLLSPFSSIYSYLAGR